ncbi:MAG: D-glucuronyl C5-epimerase family protein [bacterium]
MSQSNILGNYYINFQSEYKKISNGKLGPFDELGIPQVDYDRWYKKNRVSEKSVRYGIHYTPVTIAHFAFGKFSKLSSNGNKEDEKENYLRIADWFVKNIHKTGKGFGVWLHHFHMPIYELKPPWVSAMAQGEGISVLLRAYQLTYHRKYLDIARLALKSFKFNLREGGVYSVDNDGNIWFEEYPTNPPCHVLNGFIFALLGLWEYFKLTDDKNAKILWEKGLSTLEKNIHLYDCGYWTIYDQFTRHLVGKKYHDLHIQQMRILYEVSNKKIFSKYYHKWNDYKNSPICQLKRIIIPRLKKDYISRHLKRISFMNHE